MLFIRKKLRFSYLSGLARGDRRVTPPRLFGDLNHDRVMVRIRPSQYLIRFAGITRKKIIMKAWAVTITLYS